MRPLALILPFALLLAPAVAQEDPPPVPMVKEKATKVEFPVTMPSPGAEGETLHLLGTTVREKTFLGVNVYAYGIYVDPYGAQAELKEAWGETSQKKLRKEEQYFLDVLNGDFTKSIRMVFVRKVDGEDVAKAFEKDLPPRIENAEKYYTDWPKSAGPFETFQTYFEVDKLVKGSELVLTWHPDGRVTSRVLGVAKPDLVAPGLGWAMFDLFLGQRPLEKSKRKYMADRANTVLNLDLPERPAPVEKPGEERPAEKRSEAGRALGSPIGATPGIPAH